VDQAPTDRTATPGRGRVDWPGAAARAGLDGALWLRAEQIRVAEWVRFKCRYGCPDYGRRLSCAPHAPTPEALRAVLSDYSTALLLWIEADSARDDDAQVRARLHRGLLELERAAFLAGHHKAFALSDGPCTWCEEPCPEDGRCRKPEMLRPAMPACGVDVFATAEAAGLTLSVVGEGETRYKHVGMLLIE
jgi:5-hydroxybenzimidazole methyltransferase